MESGESPVNNPANTWAKSLESMCSFQRYSFKAHSDRGEKVKSGQKPSDTTCVRPHFLVNLNLANWVWAFLALFSYRLL